MSDEPPNAEKIDELEAQVSKQQQVINMMAEQMEAMAEVLPDSTRRRVMMAGGAAALFGAGAVGGASATPGDDGDTVWGSSSNRDDYYVDEIDANLVNTDQLKHGIEGTSSIDSSRSFDTVYQNTSGRNMLLVVVVENASGSAGNLDVIIEVGSSSSPSARQDVAKIDVANGNKIALKAIVPDQNYYQVRAFGVGSILRWYEHGYRY